ncbi:MAG: rhodanese-like domain-containing protein [Candidatus Zixiibacteriota bacterium]
MIRQTFILLAISTVLGLAANLLSPNRIPLIGAYRDLHSGSGPIVPPTAEAGDPPFIDVNTAQMEHSLGQSLFVDARNPEEFACGTIPSAIDIPFEQLPDGDLGPYLDSALGKVAKDHRIVCFCSGEECDLSLHLARNLKQLGYTQLAIFFGGAREWEKFGFAMERRKQCGN